MGRESRFHELDATREARISGLSGGGEGDKLLLALEAAQRHPGEDARRSGGSLTMSSASGSFDYDRFDELAREFADRCRGGQRPDLQEYVDRYPAMAGKIRELFPALVKIEQIKIDASASAPVPPMGWTPCLTQVGDYRILREIGRGGMGVVYEAEQVSLGRRVALKVLPGRVASDRKALERFRREAKAAARLHHTNIVPVFEVGRDGEVAFYAMQFIQGQGLDQVIGELKQLRGRDCKSGANGQAGSEGRPDQAARIPSGHGNALAGESSNPKAERVAESLLMGRLGTEVPAALVAPDRESNPTEPLAPSSRFEADPRGGNPSLTDPAPGSEVSSSAVLPGGTVVSTIESVGRRLPFFHGVAEIGRQAAQGLAHAHTRGILHRDIKPSNLLLDTAGVVWITDFGLAKLEDDGLTASGDVLGTLRYMPPERFRGEGDARADVYALGMTLYELLTLRPAFDASDRLKLVEQVKSVEPSRPRAVDGRIPLDLETIVLKAIDKDPKARYPSAEAMGDDLERFLADEPIRARQISAAERYWRMGQAQSGHSGARRCTDEFTAARHSWVAAGSAAVSASGRYPERACQRA